MMLWLLGAPAPAPPPPTEPYLVRTGDGGAVNWLEGEAAMGGRAAILHPIGTNPILYRKTRETAEADARKRLLPLVGSLWADASTRLHEKPGLPERVEKLVKGARSDVEEDTGRFFKVVVRLPLLGQDGLLRHLIEPKEGVEPAASLPHDSPEAPTGLVIDARGVDKPSPALLPRLLDEQGAVVYSLDMVDPVMAAAHGVAVYASSFPSAPLPERLVAREGDRPLQVRALSAGGTARSDLVIAAADAERIRQASATGSFLRDCRVLILMPPAPRPPARVVQPRRKTGYPDPPAATDPNRLH